MTRNTLLLMLLAVVLGVTACGPKEVEKPAREEQVATPEKPEEKEEQPPARAEELIWVFESRGSLQCEGGGTTLAESSSRLSAEGVTIHQSRCGVRTDRMYPAVCGGKTGDIHLHLIDKRSLDAALQLGFDPAQQAQYQSKDCPSGEN
ncbi:hypothetical protein AUP74_03123 [Microbulbifer aggregans]|uniref:Lipoprotein n=1 Tax=Microbulbifer aggregans TaxID=1769779 RepID=A0A1C9WBH3_9GAMM|nr:hypothetical protein [Microbulbifer aggregans]AOS98489.1 hypothetical protein AUP74_03123 [Microbulbifer aggregans]